MMMRTGSRSGPYYSIAIHEKAMSNVRARHVPFANEIAWRLAIVPVLIVLCLLLKAYLPLEVCDAHA